MWSGVSGLFLGPSHGNQTSELPAGPPEDPLWSEGHSVEIKTHKHLETQGNGSVLTDVFEWTSSCISKRLSTWAGMHAEL